MTSRRRRFPFGYKQTLPHMLTHAALATPFVVRSERRLARLLLLLANFGKEGRQQPMIAKISQKTLAEMIGTTRSRVSFFMNKFRELGFIAYNGRIHVHSSLSAESRRFLRSAGHVVPAS
jgi:CRP-like cAMP-binding protein